jgi:hypothetical protein
MSLKLTDDGLSIHCDNLSPVEVAELIHRMQGMLILMERKKVDPIETLKRSARFMREEGKISFHLSWAAPPMYVNVYDGKIPEPNVSLDREQRKEYDAILLSMISAL